MFVAMPTAMVSMISRPRVVWVFIISHSSGASFAGSSRKVSRTAMRPTSRWSTEVMVSGGRQSKIVTTGTSPRGETGAVNGGSTPSQGREEECVVGGRNVCWLPISTRSFLRAGQVAQGQSTWIALAIAWMASGSTR
jgi:hypothetical protein